MKSSIGLALVSVGAWGLALACSSGSTAEQAASLGSLCSPSGAEAEPPFSPAAGQPGSKAIPMDDPGILVWAGAVTNVTYGERVDDAWRVPSRALGPAQGTSEDVVSLGEGGSITLAFDPPLSDGEGPDLAVFENAFSDDFLELGTVEVTSDQVHFVRFAVTSLSPEPIGEYAALDPTLIDGFAGKFRQGFAVPFDLDDLSDRPEVIDGQLDLSRIVEVRITDVIGDGSEQDCGGRPIYDPYPTRGSAGFDLDAIAGLHVAP